MKPLTPLYLFLLLLPTYLTAQTPGTSNYDIGSPTLTDIWVDPTSGNDENSGASRTTALQTINAAWAKIPESTTLSTTGYRIMLVSGTYPESSIPNYWENRWGTYQYPIIIQAADGQGTALLEGDINSASLRYFYLLDFNIIPNPAGDVIHIERGDHILLRNMYLDGAGQGTRAAHETIKMNQSQYVYIESSNIGGSYENAIDFVAVQYGHIINNILREGDDWCIYLKGGSAYFLIEGNEIYDCGTGGFTAGQGTGFEYMTSPWLHYEAYDIKFVNNVIHDTMGAGFGVNGGYNILLAHNTLYKVGTRSHLIETVFGSRSCDGDSAACATRLAAGGWGGSNVGTTEVFIPNKNISILNNIVYNPSGTESGYQHFAVYGPRAAPNGSNLTSPAKTDDNLVIKGNVIWNGASDKALGIEGEDQGCTNSNPTCNAAQLIADNAINTFEPALQNPAAGDFRPTAAGNIFTYTGAALTSFSGGDRQSTPQAPEGNLANTVPSDRGTSTRSSVVVGAYASADSSIASTAPSTRTTTGSGVDSVGPSITISSLKAVRSGKKVTVTIRTVIEDNSAVQSASADIQNTAGTSLTSVNLADKGSNKYSAKKKFKLSTRTKKLKIVINASDGEGNATSKGKRVKVL